VSLIDVTCAGGDGTWTCGVRVADRGSTTDHEVLVTEIDLPPSMEEPGLDDIERLVQETFAFLLEREPKEAILRRFELGVVERYFPDYPAIIDRRLRR
jgi:hypothetical protein